MPLLDKLNADIKEAMKARNKSKISVLRMMLSEIKYAQVDEKETLSDEEVAKVVLGYSKKLKKSLHDYPEGESKDKICSEIDIVSVYLPQMATDQEISIHIDDVLKNFGEDKPQFGQVMKKILGHFGPTADGKTISRILKQKLG